PEQRIVPQHGALRSAFVEPYRCTNVLFQGITLRQAQFWQLHPTLCSNVTVDSVTTGATANLNTDGCNPESCDHVVIKRCAFDAADDCIAIKSGRDEDGRRVNVPSQNIVIFSCRLRGPSGGLAFGSEMTGGIRNVYAYDLQTDAAGVQYMFHVKSNTKRGGFAERLRLDTVRADRLSGGWALAQMDYNGQNGDHSPVFRDWSIGNASGDSDPWVLHLSGRPDSPIRGVEVHQSVFTNIGDPINQFSNVSEIQLNDVSVNGRRVLA
ncbi:MAG: glycosyl hydrolase family 28 protein, partial [Candidatus Dormibacteraeota bacterium]|nr:glycosyl hydrolase family 28 protein [Candidatus Dormibacteraeota bacterium]